MEYTQYWQIDAQADRLFAEERYDECLQLLEQALKQFPENVFDILWYKAVIYAHIQDDQECLNNIELLIGQGFTCPPKLELVRSLERGCHVSQTRRRELPSARASPGESKDGIQGAPT